MPNSYLNRNASIQLRLPRPGDDPLPPPDGGRALPLVPRIKSHPHFFDTECDHQFGNLFIRLARPGRRRLKLAEQLHRNDHTPALEDTLSMVGARSGYRLPSLNPVMARGPGSYAPLPRACRHRYEREPRNAPAERSPQFIEDFPRHTKDRLIVQGKNDSAGPSVVKIS